MPNSCGLVPHINKELSKLLHGFFFNLIPLEYKAVFPPLPRTYILQECFFWDALSSIVTALFMATHAIKTSPFMTPLNLEKRESHTKEDEINREVVPVQRCSSRPVHQVTLFFWHAQIFSDNFPRIFFSHVQPTCDHSNSQVTIATHFLPFNIELTLVCWRPFYPRVIFYLFVTIFEFSVPLKNMCARHRVISTHLQKHFKCL